MNIKLIIEQELDKLIEDYSKLDRNNIYKILDDFDIQDNHTDHYKGQDYYTAFLLEKGTKNILAKVDYSIYNNEITISIIYAVVKGKGYGKILMLYLAKKYGYENLQRSALTNDGVKMRKELDNLFNFDYEAHLKSLNKLIDNSELDKIKNKYIKMFLKDLAENGNHAWNYIRDYEKYMDGYDLNDLADITEYLKDSVDSIGYLTDEPPQHITDLLKELQK